MTQAVFHVRFHNRNPGNAYALKGAGRILVEQDFVTIEGKARRSFRLAQARSERLRMVDIVNVWSDGSQFVFDVQRVGGMDSVGCTVDTPEAARALMALLPARQTAEYAIEQAERDLFHERIDYHSQSSPVMWTLVAANSVIFLLMWMKGVFSGTPSQTAQGLIAWGSNAGVLTLHGQWWRLVTSMFLHGGWPHILFNMVALVQVGALVERMFGSVRFLAVYLVAGICGGLASVMWNANVNSVGASGAIFGIMGGLLAFILKPDSGVPMTIVKALRSSATGFLIFNIFAGIVYPHTDNAAHLGGLAGGFLAGLLLARSLHIK
ncbi:MAG: rhomboid family intramembrane serine protease [Telluria sp.]